MDDVDAILGIHNLPEYDAGDICIKDGGMMFAGEGFEIKVIGKAGHGAMPEGSVDALLIGSKIAENIAKAFRGKAEVNFDMHVPAVINSLKVGIYVRESAKKVVANGRVLEAKSLKSSNDFSYFLDKAPGYYVFIGSGVKDISKRKPIHSERFLLDEEFITTAAALYAQFAKDYLINKTRDSNSQYLML